MTGDRTRRAVLATAASLALAGCSGQSGGGTTGGGTGGGTTIGTTRTATDTETATETATPTETGTPAASEYAMAEPPAFDEPDATQNGVETFRDVTYRETPDEYLELDLHRPASGSGPHPLVVHIHGGGWVFGDKQWDEEGRWHANLGTAAASIEYRLAGTAHYPAAVRDTFAAVTWLREHAAEAANIDPERVVLIGESAGAHLSALTAVAPDESNFQPQGVDARVDGIDGVIPISGVFNLTEDRAARDRAALAFFGCSGNNCPETYEEASPITYVDSNDPPHLLYHGTADERIPYRTATQYRDALQEVDVPVTLITGEGGDHVSPYSGSWGDRMRNTQRQFLQNRLEL